MIRGDWTVVVDFDGTICPTDVVDALLERHGLEGWRELEAAWQQGRIGSRDCLRRQITLLDVTRSQLDAFLDELAIDPAFPKFVAMGESLGYEIHVVSDGLDHAIHRILGRFGLSRLPVHANELAAASAPGRWRLTSPNASAGCSSGTCKCAVATPAWTRPGGRTLLVGDGASDFCIAGRVDLVLAKNRLQEHCRRSGIRHLPIHGFADAVPVLERLDSFVAPQRLTVPPAGRTCTALRNVP